MENSEPGNLVSGRVRVRGEMSSWVRDVSQQDTDLVLVCEGGEMVAFHTELVLVLFPAIKKVLDDVVGGMMRDVFTLKSSKIYITVQGLGAALIRSVMDSVYSGGPLNFSQSELGDVRDCFRMLGVEEDMFFVEKSSMGQLEDMEDSKIVDVIQDLMEDFKVNPLQSENELQDIIFNDIEPGIFTDISQDDLQEDERLLHAAEAEKLLAEDEEKAKLYEMEEKLKKEQKIKMHDMKMKDCSVTMENVSMEVLRHYVNIAERNLTTSETKPDQEDLDGKRKRRKKMDPEFKYDPEKSGKAIHENSNDSLKKVSLSLEETSENIPEVKVTENNTNALDQTGVEFLETRTVACLMCSMEFNTRYKLISHLCVKHYAGEIFSLYPYEKGAPCQLCVSGGKRKILELRDKNTHVRHIGVSHEVVLEIVTQDVRESVERFSRMSRRPPPPKFRVKKEKWEVEQMEDTRTSFNQEEESPEDNYEKLLKEYNQHKQNTSNTTLTETAMIKGDDSNSSLIAQAEELYFEETTDISEADQTLLDKYILKSENETPIDSSDSKVLSGQSNESIVKENLTPRTFSMVCPLCTNNMEYRAREELTTHLSLAHHSLKILSQYPFQPGQVCKLCLKSRKGITFGSSQAFLVHIGAKHEQVLQFLTPDLHKKINQLPTNQELEDQQQPQPSDFRPELNSTFKEEVVVKKEVMVSQQDSLLECMVCSETGIKSRYDLLLHYSLKHYQQEIVTAFPFQPNEVCRLCQSLGRPNPFNSKSVYRHIKHVGAAHEKVTQFFSPDITNKMRSIPTKKPFELGTPSINVRAVVPSIQDPTNVPPGPPGPITRGKPSVQIAAADVKDIKDPCKYCGKGNFASSKQLKIHLLSHRNELLNRKPI